VSCAGLLFYGTRGPLVLEPDDADARRLAALLGVFVDELGTRDDIQGEMLRMLLKRLLIRLTRLARATVTARGAAESHVDLVRQFDVLVEQHYRRRHRVQDYARLLHRSDARGEVAAAFGLRFELPPYLVEVYRELKNNLPAFDDDPGWTLPMPARYVIGQDGMIRSAEVNPDYTRRPEPEELLPALRQAAAVGV
jgi:hypothetical protein